MMPKIGGMVMPVPLADQIMEKIDQAAELYHRLILVIAPSGAGKTAALQDVRDRTGATLINVNLEVSRLMLEMTQRQRTLELPRLLQDISARSQGEVILFDNVEVLFDVELKQDPLRLLQGISRNKTVVCAWSGSVVNNILTYATPEHPEYKRYPVNDFLVARLETVK